MKKIKIIILFLLVITLLSCLDTNNKYPNLFIDQEKEKVDYMKDNSYQYPSKSKPKDELVLPDKLEGIRLEFDTVIIEDNILNKNYTGMITNNEDYLKLNLNTNLGDTFFDDYFLIIKSGLTYQNPRENININNNIFIGATIIDNRINILLEYVNLDEYNVNNIYLYSFKKIDGMNESYGITYLGYQKHYKSKSSYLTIYFDNLEDIPMKVLAKDYLKAYNLNKTFYLEETQDYSNSIRLRVSDLEVSLDEVSKVLNNALDDKLVLYYTLYNPYSNNFEKALSDKNILIQRDDLNGFDLNYDNNFNQRFKVIKTLNNFNEIIDEYINKRENIDDFHLETIEGLKKIYNKDFFDSYNLILFGLTEGSGSINHYIPEVNVINNKAILNLYRLIPLIGTDDMAYYTVYFKASKEIDDININSQQIRLYSSDIE